MLRTMECKKKKKKKEKKKKSVFVMQKRVLVSVPVPVVSTVSPKVAWSFELYLYIELTVPQVSDCSPLGRLIYCTMPLVGLQYIDKK